MDVTNIRETADKLHQAAGLLSPAQEVLDRFNYKHKNQHRVTKWWAKFDMVRRHVRKLSQDGLQPAVDAAAAATAVPGASRKSSKKRTHVGGPRPHVIPIEVVATLQEKARWMCNFMIPKAYIAFSQLAADNQFAHLGLLLIGVLARVHSAVSLLLPVEEGHPKEEEGSTARELPDTASTGDVRPLQAPRRPVACSPSPKHDELGIAVGRDEVAVEAGPVAAVGRGSHGDSASKSGRDSAPQVSTRAQEEPPPRNTGRKDKIKKMPKANAREKKKRRKGDEFDDLFSGLL